MFDEPVDVADDENFTRSIEMASICFNTDEDDPETLIYSSSHLNASHRLHETLYSLKRN